MKILPLILAFCIIVSHGYAERINHEGRILGTVPTITEPILFNTPEADATVSAMQIMPRDNPWNEDISRRPTLSNSDAMITQITNDLASNRRTLRAFFEMNYVLVPDSQPTRSIRFFNYPDESELDGGISPNALYPIPTTLPVETWPQGTGNLTLQQWQQDVNNTGGDRHSIIVKPGAGLFWETWLTKLVGNAWQASNGAKFNLNSNGLRPAGWTSADAAGLPMFPAVVRYDECQRGIVEHALRLIVKRTRVGPIYPATHSASVGNTTDPNIPAMGQRLRLKQDFIIPEQWTKEEKAVLRALKKYGAIVADNGNFFSISVCPDNRFPSGAFNHLSSISISNFEVIQTTGPTEGPRSPSAPITVAGADQTIAFGSPALLRGTVSATPGSIVQWKIYSGPGTVTFTNVSQPETTANFSLPGRYTLMLSTDDGIHTVAYDAVVIDVVLKANITRRGNDIVIRFPSAMGFRYRVRYSSDMSSSSWTTLADNIAGTGSEYEAIDGNALTHPKRFYSVEVVP